MALLDNLFSKKMPARGASEPEDGRDLGDTSSPSMPSSGGHASDRKNLRLERRELLYAVVRESMARVGVLSSCYKYKVLSLDPRGRQYLIMMDLPQELASETRLLADIESVITQNAKARHDIVVKAVYWRISGLVSSDLSRKAKANLLGDTSLPRQQAPALARQTSRFEPIRQDEVAAFKQALTGGTNSEGSAPPAKLIKSWRRNPALRADFADTQLQDSAAKTSKPARRDFQDTEAVDSVEKINPLSRTQYGDLI
jgi:hypothetical protein